MWASVSFPADAGGAGKKLNKLTYLDLDLEVTLSPQSMIADNDKVERHNKNQITIQNFMLKHVSSVYLSNLRWNESTH